MMPTILTRHLLATGLLLLLCAPFATTLHAADGVEAGEAGTVFTFWPLIDYRESPREGFSNLAILGPLFKLQHQGEERDFAIRPLFYNSTFKRDATSQTIYLYPLAATETTPTASKVSILELFQTNIYRKGEEGEEQNRMLLPLYISGRSNKYGPYKAFFPFYGDLYERFWRDEIHFVMFPLYSRTVKRGTTNRNFLYPIISLTSGEGESGFQFWPLYGQSAKEGVYGRRFVLWPLYMQEQAGIDTANPTRKLYLFPFYAASDAPDRTSRHYLWPLVGHVDDRGKKLEEWDYFWPFWYTVRGKTQNTDSYLPFYSRMQKPEVVKQWYMWPLYSHEDLDSESYRQTRDRVLYWFYTDKRESWPVDGKERRRLAFWPLFLYNTNPRGVKSFSFPAPVEPVLDREEIEKAWAPFWRLYLQKWNDAGDSVVSVFWNLYWHERRGDELAYEFFPLLAYSSEQKRKELKVLKGLIRYRNIDGESNFSLLWLPFGISWGNSSAAANTTGDTMQGASGAKNP